MTDRLTAGLLARPAAGPLLAELGERQPPPGVINSLLLLARRPPEGGGRHRG